MPWSPCSSKYSTMENPSSKCNALPSDTLFTPPPERMSLQPSNLKCPSHAKVTDFGASSENYPTKPNYIQAGDLPETDEVDIDVVNVSFVNHEEERTLKITPNKNYTERTEVAIVTRYSTPVSDKPSALRFTPICSPIKTSAHRPSPALSPDSSGYSSSTPVSSVASRFPSDLIISDVFSPSDRQYIGGARKYTQSTSASSFGCDRPISRVSRQCCSPTDSPPHFPQKNGRTTYTSAQVRVLERVFQTTQYPEADKIEEISKEINVPANKIKVWFQNKRARTRRFMGVPLQNSIMPGFMPPVIGTAHMEPNNVGFMTQPGYLPSIAQIPQASQMSHLASASQLAAMSPMHLYYQGAIGHCLSGMYPAYIPSAPHGLYSDYTPLGYPYPTPFVYHQTSPQEDDAKSMYLPPNGPCSYPSS